jgi:ParB family chromosome partitioning protein
VRITVRATEQWAERELSARDVRVREACMRALATFADALSVARLAQSAATDSESNLRQRATDLLLRTSHATVDKALLKLLKAQDTSVSLKAFDGLTSRGSTAIVTIADTALASGKPELGLRTVDLLKSAAADSQPALDRLIAELNGKSADVRRAAFDALAAYFTDQPMQAVWLGTQSKHADLREYALRSSHGLGLLGSPSCIRLIRRHLNDDAAEVRRMAFVLSLLTQPKIATVVRGLSEDVHRWLAELDKAKRSKPKRSEIDALEAQDLAPLIDAMSSWRTDIALLAARALAGLGDLRAFGALLQVSRDPDEQNRIRVCQGFRTLGDMNAVPCLVKMLRDPALNVADAAFTALSSLWRKTPLPAVDAGMQASEGKVRQRAAALTVKLVKAETKGALERLRHALDDSAPAVQREAFKAALNLGVGDDRESTLRFALESAHADIRRDVLLELHEEKKSAWAQGILSDFLDDGDARIRRDSLKLLCEVARDPIAVYGTALSSQRDDARGQAARELSRLDFNHAIADLLATAITDPARDVRNNAMSGLVTGEAMPQLQAALKSEFADVRTAAALALAAHGLAAVKKPLLKVIGLPEPEKKSERTTWKEQVSQALRGLGVLADPKTVDALLAMVADPNGQFCDEAAAALFTVAGPKQQEAIATLYRQAQGSLKRTLGLALTATGSGHAAAAVLGKANADSSCSC